MSSEWMDAYGIAEAIKRGRLTAQEMVQNTIERAHKVDAILNCFTEVFDHSAIEDAKRVDIAINAGSDPGPLAGVPFAVKSLFDIAGVVTLAGSKINREHPPAKKDASVIRRLREAGAILVGTLGMDEYAYGFTTENSHYGPVRNPYDPNRTAGGSSGGSGAAVASGCVPIALGTDTNGSVRVPASVCGLIGLKPTFGRVSRAGTTFFTPSLDHVGFFTRNVRDAAICFDLTQGNDPADPISSQRLPEIISPTLDSGISGLKIARAVGYFEEGATIEALDATKTVARLLGANAEQIIPEAKVARSAAMILSAVEGSSLHFKDLQKRPADFDPMTRDRFIAGALLTGEAYARAQMFRLAYKEAFRRIFQNVDILVAPATPMVAPNIGQNEIEIDGQIFPSRAHLGKFTQPISFVGLPVVVIPTLTDGGLPIGVQLIGAPYQERTLFQAARYLETHGGIEIFHPHLESSS